MDRQSVMSDCDALVVGAGSAGCVLSARLSDTSSRKVVLLEAGPDYGPFDRAVWPPELLDHRALPTTHDWGLWNQSRPSRGGEYPLSCAKVIGGSSSHNGCGILWPRPVDFANWVALGCAQWAWDDVWPYIARVEQAVDGAHGFQRGHSGQLPVTIFAAEPLLEFYESLVEGCVSLGWPYLNDPNAFEAEVGIGRTSWNIHQDVRWNAAFAYLDPVRQRPNLTVMAESMAKQITISHGRAQAVTVVHRNGTTASIKADKIFITAGTYNSPLLLQRSGVGGAQLLEDLGIDVHADLPGVGMNLLDHPVVPIRFLATRYGHAEGRRMLSTDRPSRSAVDIRLQSPMSLGGSDVHINLSPGSEVQDGWEYLVRVELFRPRSRGYVELTAANVTTPARIDSRFLSENSDVAVAKWGIEQVRRLFRSRPMQRWIVAERSPGPLTPEDLTLWLRSSAYTFHHPVGTCRMGLTTDGTAVVNQDGFVHGLPNVVVADASIMPDIPAALPNLTVLAVAERVAARHAEWSPAG
jgi:choline dehydrogenase